MRAAEVMRVNGVRDHSIVRITLDYFGLLWITLDYFGLLWINLDYFGLIRIN